MERKCTDRQYHVKDNADVAHKGVIMYFNKNQFPASSFCGPLYKPHVTRGMNKHYHLRFYPKLGNGVCEIQNKTCACIACTSMIYKPWISGIPSYKQELYKPVTKCNYWPVLGPSNNWNIIQLSQKSTTYDPFDETHQVVLDGISDNMASLVEPGKYGAINTTDTTTSGFYVIMFTS